MVSSHGHVAKPEDQVKSSKTFTGNYCKKALGCSNLFHVEVNVFLGASPGNQDTPMLVFKIWKYIMDSVALNHSDLWQYFTCGVTL